ncbi:DUF3137 domain-containing protein [Candidatus Saccharibacteria bacterium]|nr:DUF3137 domain-containing protein [Candidatus Saccharibacteria bacterium]
MQIQKLERLRAEYHAKYKKAQRYSLIVAAVCAVVILAVSLMTFRGGKPSLFSFMFVLIPVIMAAIFPYVLGMIIFYIANRKLVAEYRALYKTTFVEKALGEVFPGCSYQMNAGVDESELLATNMVDTGDVYRSEDLVCGEYNGLKFRQADVLIQEREEDEDGHTSYRTVFRGRWAIFDIKKSFQYRLAVVGGRFGVASLRNRDKIHKFRRVTLESNAFHNHFKVYAEDGFEAFYLLDPAFIERVERLGEAHGGRVALFFIGGELHIAVDNQSNAFEVASINRPIDVKAEVARVRADIKLITDIVDSLKLK